MARIKETLEFEINGKTIELINDGIKKLEDQKDGIENAKGWIKENLAKGFSVGWTPYANFESTLEWKIKPQSGALGVLANVTDRQLTLILNALRMKMDDMSRNGVLKMPSGRAQEITQEYNLIIKLITDAKP